MAAGLQHAPPTSLEDPLEPCQLTEPAGDCGGTKQGYRERSSRWTSILGFVVFIAICGTATFHSRGDRWGMAFVLGSYLVLLCLLCALRACEALPRGSPRRARAKAAVWGLSTVLTLVFTQRVAALMPAVLVWVMAGSTISGGFYMFFVCPDGDATAEEEPGKVADIA